MSLAQRKTFPRRAARTGPRQPQSRWSSTRGDDTFRDTASHSTCRHQRTGNGPGISGCRCVLAAASRRREASRTSGEDGLPAAPLSWTVELQGDDTGPRGASEEQDRGSSGFSFQLKTCYFRSLSYAA